MTSSRGCRQEVTRKSNKDATTILARMSSTRLVRVVLVDFGERHLLTDKRAAVHRSRPSAVCWTGKSPDMHDLLRVRNVRVGKDPREDITRMLCGKWSSGIEVIYGEKGPYSHSNGTIHIAPRTPRSPGRLTKWVSLIPGIRVVKHKMSSRSN